MFGLLVYFQGMGQYMGYASSRRPPLANNKPYKCLVEGCTSSFYDSRNLRTHEVKKHGRKKKYARNSGLDTISQLMALYKDVNTGAQESDHRSSTMPPPRPALHLQSAAQPSEQADFVDPGGNNGSLWPEEQQQEDPPQPGDDAQDEHHCN